MNLFICQPENVICVEPKSTRIKLIDFGLARQLDEGKETKVICGTPEFVGMVLNAILLYDDYDGYMYDSNDYHFHQIYD